MCPHEQENFWAVGFWYDVFTQVENEDVVALLDELRASAPAPPQARWHGLSLIVWPSLTVGAVASPASRLVRRSTESAAREGRRTSRRHRP